MKLERINSSGETQEISVFRLLTVRTFILQRNEKQQAKTDQGRHDS